jgi:rubrerythrin
MIHKGIDFGDIHVPRLEGNSMDEDKIKEDEELEKGSDADLIQSLLADEAKGLSDLKEAIASAQDPKLKEVLQAVLEDEKKHNAAYEQLLQEAGGEGELDEHEAGESPEDEASEADEDVEAGLDEDDEEPLDKDEAGGKGDLIDDIRSVLEAHETEKGEDTGEDEEDEPDLEKSEGLEEGDEEDDGLEKSVTRVAKSYRVPILKADKQIVWGVVSEPGSIDLQGDRLSESEIRKACHKFMAESQKIGVEHDGIAKADIIESYIAPTDFECGGQSVRKGSWVMAVKVNDKDLWQSVKKGDITGFSIAGTGTRTPF